MEPRVGDLVGNKYRVLRLIGDGGMGAVFEARHEVLGTSVALKFLHSELSRRSGLTARFLQEARVSASIQSPHVTRVTDVDQTADGSPYLVMELLSGESLQQVIDRRRKLPRDQAVDFALQILAGLEAAHALGVVHRDLKPDNVFVTPSNGGPVLKLLDFGIAKLRETSEYQKGLTRPGSVMGTPEYMPPEQLFAAERVDHRADLYSAGAILYELLVGERPAYGDDAMSIVRQVLEGRVRRVDQLDPSIPGALADVVARALEPNPDRRFASALEVRLALAPFAGELSHAGRLAATPAPAALTSATNHSEHRPAASTHVDPPALDAAPRVAPTLPPDDPEPPRGSTQAAPPVAPAGTAFGPVLAHTPAVYAAPLAPQPVVRPRRSPAVWIVLASLLGAGAASAAVWLIVERGRSDSPPRLHVDTSGPPTTLSAAAPPLEQPPSSPAPATAPRVAAHPPAGRARTDGGAADAGAAPPFPTWQIPSAFPIPTALPTALPTGFPTIPGWGAPPAASQ